MLVLKRHKFDAKILKTKIHINSERSYLWRQNNSFLISIHFFIFIFDKIQLNFQHAT